MGNDHLFCLLISFILVFSTHFALPGLAAKVPTCYPSDNSALLDLKSALSSISKNKKILTSWSSPKSCCAWRGVTCNPNGRVTQLSITDAGIAVKKPKLLGPALSKLTELQVLSFQNLVGSNNMEYIPLPSELKSLTKLISISLLDNSFGGSIPSEWSQISSLQTLNLSNNPLISGSIPATFCNLKNLQAISVINVHQVPGQQGALSGTIPSCLSSLTQLTVLELANNQISGSIPTEIGQLTNLSILHLSNNQLTGSIPSSVGNLKKLRVLRLEGNAFSGNLPQSLGNLVNLQELRLGGADAELGNLEGFNKQLSGNYPVGIGGKSFLQILHIRGTSIGGTLPASLGSGLLDVALDNNEFSGEIPPSLGEALNLTTINLANNHFQGGIPSSLTSLSLSTLDLSSNQLTGSIPIALGNALYLGSLNLQNNKLSGEFPKSLWNVSTVNLSNNQLTALPAGNVPYGFTMQIQKLFLDSNNFSGTIPEWTLTPLLFINLANNKFNSFSVIDDSVSLSMSYFNASKNLLTGSIPDAFANVYGLNTLDLSFNRFTGSIPSKFTSGSGFFNNLVLSHNQLSGPLPDQLFASGFFNSLDLSHNNLSGAIPDIFPNESSFLSSVDLSFNHLSGIVPQRLLNYSYYLTKLKLSHNEFSGPIPDFASACHTNRINFVALNDNKFTGTLQGASWIADCATQMEVFDISGNQVSGPVPDLSSWKALKVLNLARNQFTGKIPAFLMGGLPALQVLDLSGNKLSGVESWNKMAGWEAMKSSNGSSNDPNLLQKGIYYEDGLVFGDVDFVVPFTLTLSATTAIDVSGNAITSQLPSNMGSQLPVLRVLDVSNNKFSGTLPADMTSLRLLDVSNNAFTGKIPSNLQNFPASDFAGNPGLCGSPLTKKC